MIYIRQRFGSNSQNWNYFNTLQTYIFCNVFTRIKYQCVKSIMIISKVNMATNRNYYSQILTAGCMKLELKMLLTILIRTEKCLLFVKILINWNIICLENKTWNGKHCNWRSCWIKAKNILNSSEYKKAKGLNKNAVAKMST